jgi:hypothetical protein
VVAVVVEMAGERVVALQGMVVEAALVVVRVLLVRSAFFLPDTL